MLGDVPLGPVVQYSLVLLALIFGGWVVVWQVRRRLTRPDESSGAGFSLSDLRRLHKSRQMSDEEFERAKAKVVEAAQRAAARDAAAAGGSAGRGEALRANRSPPDGEAS